MDDALGSVFGGVLESAVDSGGETQGVNALVDALKGALDAESNVKAAGTTETAVLSDGGVAYNASVPMGSVPMSAYSTVPVSGSMLGTAPGPIPQMNYTQPTSVASNPVAAGGVPLSVNQATPQPGTVPGNIVYINGVPHVITQPVDQTQNNVAYNGIPTTAYTTTIPGQQANVIQQPSAVPNTSNASRSLGFGFLNNESKQVAVTLNGQPVDPNTCHIDGKEHQWNTEYTTIGILASVLIPIFGLVYCLDSSCKRCIKCQAVKKKA
jgi:hypothetical protein